MSDGKTVGECFQFNEETRERVEKLEQRHDKLSEKVFEKLDRIEEKFVNRLPGWGMILFGIMTAVIGGLLVKALR